MEDLLLPGKRERSEKGFFAPFELNVKGHSLSGRGAASRLNLPSYTASGRGGCQPFIDGVKSDHCSILNALISLTEFGNHSRAFNAFIA